MHHEDRRSEWPSHCIELISTSRATFFHICDCCVEGQFMPPHLQEFLKFESMKTPSTKKADVFSASQWVCLVVARNCAKSGLNTSLHQLVVRSGAIIAFGTFAVTTKRKFCKRAEERSWWSLHLVKGSKERKFTWLLPFFFGWGGLECQRDFF